MTAAGLLLSFFSVAVVAVVLFVGFMLFDVCCFFSLDGPDFHTLDPV
jgi:hypothetical protein